tara:strand:+ start:179 stop:799 length:621 start_codon:yes stop_codon:yes gene_type:complete
MPTVSKKQEKFMQAVANNPKFANKVGVNQSIGREFTKENNMKQETKKMMGGGMADRRGRAMTRMGADAAGRAMNYGGKVKKMNKGGPTARTKHIMNEKEEISRVDKEIRKNEGYKAGGMMKDKEGRAMKKGGKVKKQGYNARLDESLGARKGKKKQSMKARRDESKGAKKAAGKKAYSGNRSSAQGSASKRADGIAKKGRTKGRMV